MHDGRPPHTLWQVNGQKVTGDEAGLGETVGLISKSEGPVEIKLRRNGQELVKKVTPRVNPDTGRSSIGVQMAAHIEVRARALGGLGTWCLVLYARALGGLW